MTKDVNIILTPFDTIYVILFVERLQPFLINLPLLRLIVRLFVLGQGKGGGQGKGDGYGQGDGEVEDQGEGSGGRANPTTYHPDFWARILVEFAVQIPYRLSNKA